MPFAPLAVLTLPWLLAAPAERWTPGERIERTLAPGEVRRHVVSLAAGQFVRVTVVQSGIDVVVRRVGPDGAPGPDVDASEGPQGWEPCSILAETAGEHAIEVRARADARAPGGYVLESDVVRVAGPRDEVRLAGEEARRLSTPALGPRAIDSKLGPPPFEAQLEGLRQLEIAAEAFHQLGETCLEAESLTFFALISGWSSRLDEVLDVHPRAMELWERCDEPYKRAEAHIYAGEGYRRASHNARASATYVKGLALARAIGARDLEMLLLTNLGGSYAAEGETEKAIRATEEALLLLRDGGVKQGEAVALRTLAVAHLRRGAFQQAADLARSSIAIRREIGDTPGLVTTLITLGEIYLVLGEPVTARTHLDEALRIYPLQGTSSGWPRLLPALADAYEQMGDREGAREALERSLADHQRFGQHNFESVSLLTLGRLYLRAGDFDAAFEAGVEAAHLQREAGARQGLAEALELQGSAWLGRGEAAKAQVVLEEALQLRRFLQDGPGEALALHELARADLARGAPESARDRLEQALGLIDHARARIVSLDLRSSWLARTRGIHETYVAALMELDRRDPGAGWAARAFEASESARARSLVDVLAQARAGISHGVDPDLLGRERALRDRLGELMDRRLRRLASSSSVGDPLAREIASLSAEYEEVRGRLRASSPRYAALTEPERLTFEQIRSRVLDAETLLLEYSLGTDRSYLWVVGREVFAAYTLPGQAVIEAAVLRMRAEIDRRSPRASADPPLEELSRMLLDPARSHLAERRLVFVADGPLHHVPFGSLLLSGAPLVSAHEIVSAPSASAVALLRAAEATRHRPSRTLAVMADPVFDRGDARVHARGDAAPARDPSVERVTRDLGFEGGRLPRLVFTRREAQSIFALAPPGSGRLALDFEASRAAVEAPDLKEYRYLHFATHGLLNEVRPELSGLVLSLVDRDGRDKPGLLTAPDVFNLELGADLVVLSGCRTALGKEIRGEGLIGLTRAFMYAGVPRVVASLWPVDDLTTAELMKRFYEGMLGPQKLRPAAALRRAQARMARDPRWSAPYHWAGFQLQGDWR